jgi:hypothetical protein
MGDLVPVCVMCVCIWAIGERDFILNSQNLSVKNFRFSSFAVNKTVVCDIYRHHHHHYYYYYNYHPTTITTTTAAAATTTTTTTITTTTTTTITTTTTTTTTTTDYADAAIFPTLAIAGRSLLIRRKGERGVKGRCSLSFRET